MNYIFGQFDQKKERNMTVVRRVSRVKRYFSTKQRSLLSWSREGESLKKGAPEMWSGWLVKQTRSWWRLRHTLSHGRSYPTSCGIGEKGKSWKDGHHSVVERTSWISSRKGKKWSVCQELERVGWERN